MSNAPFRPQIALYRDWLKSERGLEFADYEALRSWSVTDVDGFWQSIWDYSGMQSPTPYEGVLCTDKMPGGEWFKGAHVNLTDHVFKHVDAAHAAGQPAIICENELGEVTEVSWPELRRKAISLALKLKDLGIEPGDRVAAYLPNGPETIIAFLACASVGAVWSLCAPDMGVRAVIDRFAQIEPKVLIAADGVHYAGKPMDRGQTVIDLLAELPSVQATLLVQTPYATVSVPGCECFEDAVARDDDGVAGFEPVKLPFDHPIWILYSSGTTGKPKPIVQGLGGTLITSFVNLMHMDLGPSYAENSLNERFHWFTSTGWVMWNVQFSGLIAGSTICLFNGAPNGPKGATDWTTLWRFAAGHKVTFFGSGAAFYVSCEKDGVDLSTCGDLSSVRALGSTGSPLPESTQVWGTDQFAAIGTPDIWWCNISGGTDLGGCFCTGNRELPVVPGQMQCRQLGMAVEAWNDDGQSVSDQVGELVCVRPSPGMPLRFWGDDDGERYRTSYFEKYPGIWCHGDWLKIQPDGSCIIYGRSDSTINRHGVRMGTSEIYSAVEALPEVVDSLVLDLEYLGQESRLLLFVVLRDGSDLSDDLKSAINANIRSNLSPRFVPDEIIAAPEVPRTLSGKKQEVPLKKIFLGQDASKVLTRDAMANPHVLDWYVETARRMSE